MNRDQLEVRALRAELTRAQGFINHLKAEQEKQKSIEVFLAAALTGACSRLTDAGEAARFALAATDEIVRALGAAIEEQGQDGAAEGVSEATEAPADQIEPPASVL